MHELRTADDQGDHEGIASGHAGPCLETEKLPACSARRNRKTSKQDVGAMSQQCAAKGMDLNPRNRADLVPTGAVDLTLLDHGGGRLTVLASNKPMIPGNSGYEGLQHDRSPCKLEWPARKI
jgi:hypothetical protein